MRQTQEYCDAVRFLHCSPLTFEKRKVHCKVTLEIIDAMRWINVPDH